MLRLCRRRSHRCGRRMLTRMKRTLRNFFALRRNCMDIVRLAHLKPVVAPGMSNDGRDHVGRTPCCQNKRHDQHDRCEPGIETQVNHARLSSRMDMTCCIANDKRRKLRSGICAGQLKRGRYAVVEPEAQVHLTCDCRGHNFGHGGARKRGQDRNSNEHQSQLWNGIRRRGAKRKQCAEQCDRDVAQDRQFPIGTQEMSGANSPRNAVDRLNHFGSWGERQGIKLIEATGWIECWRAFADHGFCYCIRASAQKSLRPANASERRL